MTTHSVPDLRVIHDGWGPIILAVCAICGHAIDDAEAANAVWNITGPGAIVGDVRVVHKACDDETSRSGTRWQCWQDLGVVIGQLAAGLGLDDPVRFAEEHSAHPLDSVRAAVANRTSRRRPFRLVSLEVDK